MMGSHYSDQQRAPNRGPLIVGVECVPEVILMWSLALAVFD